MENQDRHTLNPILRALNYNYFLTSPMRHPYMLFSLTTFLCCRLLFALYCCCSLFVCCLCASWKEITLNDLCRYGCGGLIAVAPVLDICADGDLRVVHRSEGDEDRVVLSFVLCRTRLPANGDSWVVDGLCRRSLILPCLEHGSASQNMVLRRYIFSISFVPLHHEA